MGIQNLQVRARQVRARQLTIPHGDSKLLYGCGRAAGPPTHYPPWGFKTSATPPLPAAPPPSLSPMGIQNLTGVSLTDAVLRLTIPHGDSKLYAAAVQVHQARPHYMGIQNGQPLFPGHRGHGLTIPHGDSKPGRIPGRHLGGAAAHYPPWGFKTPGRYPPQRGPLGAHYPPWGFKTFGTGARAGSGAVSLSPMGIQNSPSTTSFISHPELTIPHGDSKPRFYI